MGGLVDGVAVVAGGPRLAVSVRHIGGRRTGAIDHHSSQQLLHLIAHGSRKLVVLNSGLIFADHLTVWAGDLLDYVRCSPFAVQGENRVGLQHL